MTYSEPGGMQHISIHALREEGDFSAATSRHQNCDFYPRPPRGGRQFQVGAAGPSGNFYPRPPRGGRLYPQNKGCKQELFLSTPSARRATTGSL